MISAAIAIQFCYHTILIFILSMRNIIMKGMSLPTETVVIFIIAGVVLVALLMFFASIWQPGSEVIKAHQARAQLCPALVNSNPECTDASGLTQQETNDLTNACKTIGGYSACNEAGGVGCLKQCCTGWCPQPKCEEIFGTCTVNSCDQNIIFTVSVAGDCSDKLATPYCCRRPDNS
jgi:hypothetical protein